MLILNVELPVPVPLFVKLTGNVTLPPVPYVTLPTWAPTDTPVMTVTAFSEPKETKPAKMTVIMTVILFTGRKVDFFII
jgi:hypothetical protein